MPDLVPQIDPRQYGNMKGSSVDPYLVSLLDTVHRYVEKRCHSVEICTVYFMQAFDRINHTIAIEKLVKFDVNRSILPIICNFLTNRSQTVRYQGCTSRPRNITCGVPQGTKLGPIMFLVMINDAALSTDHRWKYVDDLTLLVATHKSQQSSMQTHVDSLCN